MLTYDDLQTYLQEAMLTPPTFFPGPVARAEAYTFPNSAIILTMGGGPGFILERLFEDVACLADIAGEQNDYDGAESLAKQLDDAVLAIETPRQVGASRIQFTARSGGRPSPLVQDAGDRWHFTCAYVFRVGSSG